MGTMVLVRNKHGEVVEITSKAYKLSKSSYELVDGDLPEPIKKEGPKKKDVPVVDKGEIDYKTISSDELVELIKTGDADLDKITALKLKDLVKSMSDFDESELKPLRNKGALVDFINNNIGRL